MGRKCYTTLLFSHVVVLFLSFYAYADSKIDSLEAALNVIEIAAQRDPWYARFLKGLLDARVDPKQYVREIIITAVTALVHADNQHRPLPVRPEHRAYFRGLVDVPLSNKAMVDSQNIHDIWASISEEQDTSENFIAKRCMRPRNSQTIFPPIFNPGRRPDTCVCQDLLVRGTATINTLNVLNNADIGGNLHVQGLFFLDSDTINPNNVLYVQKSIVTAPNQFNSVNDALAAITDNSAFNPYIIRITPGFFFETPINMKPFVSVQGAGNATVLSTVVPNQDLVIGADSVVLRDVTLVGAIDPGFSAITFNSGGVFLAVDTIFGANDIFASVINAVDRTLLAISRSEIFPIAQFTEAVRVVHALPTQAGVYMSQTLWNPVVATSFTNFFRASGPGAFCSGGLLALGNNPLLTGVGAAQGGVGAIVENGGRLQFTSSGFTGFDQAFFATNSGIGPIILLNAIFADANDIDVQVDHAFATGSITGVLNDEKVIINPSNTTISFFISNPETGSVMTQDGFKWGETFNQRTVISPLFNSGWNTGVVTGGALLFDTNSLLLTATAGTGYLMKGAEPTDYVSYIPWDTQSISLPVNLDSFIFINQNGTLQSSSAQPAAENAILLGKARTTGTGVLFVQEFPTDARHTGERLTSAIENSLGPIYISGSLVTSNTANQLNVGEGSYVFGTHQYAPLGSNPVSFSTWILSGSGGYIIENPSTNTVDVNSYDGGTGTLDTIPTGSYVKDILYIAGDGIYETYLFQYGQMLELIRKFQQA